MSRPDRLEGGLAALIPDDILDSPQVSEGGALKHLRLDHIKPNPEQPRMRFSAGALEELAESIRTHGVITPILVRRVSPTNYILIAGERRLRAAGLAGLDQIPAWIREDVSTKEQLEIALIENLQREDLDPIETAISYRRMIDEFDMTQADVAKRVGKDRATVANAVRLLRLPDFALQRLREGSISTGHAKALLSISESATMRQLLDEIMLKDLSVRATERAVADLIRPSRRHKKTSLRSRYQHANEKMSHALGTRVRIEPKARGKSGKITVEYFSAEDLTRLVDRLSQALKDT